MTAEHAAKEVSRCHTGAGVLGIGRAAMSYSHPTELWPTQPRRRPRSANHASAGENHERNPTKEEQCPDQLIMLSRPLRSML